MTEQCKKCYMKDLCICIPSADECHVRKQSFNKAIDEFALELKLKYPYFVEDVGFVEANKRLGSAIDEIAEQMKGE